MIIPKTLKILAIILIIGGGLVGSYFIVKNSIPIVGTNEGLASKNGESSAKSQIQWVEDALSKAGELNQQESNLTQAFSQIAFEQIKSLIASGQSNEDSASDINLMSRNLTEDFLKKSLADFNLIFDIDDSQLKISSDNSREAKIKYLDAIEEINKKNFGDFDKNYLEIIIDVFTKIDTSSASRLANIYKNLANDYLKISVPSGWIDVHKEIIIHFKNSETIYSAMAEYPNDLLKGLLAFEIIEKITVDNAQEVQKLFDKKIQEIKQ